LHRALRFSYVFLLFPVNAEALPRQKVTCDTRNASGKSAFYKPWH